MKRRMRRTLPASTQTMLAWTLALACAPAIGYAQAASAGRPGSMLDETAAPPVIHLAGGQLTIQATNSSLRAILDELQKQTGVKVEGLTADERIFGKYGPGTPQAVLSALLDDSGYNVLIAGEQSNGSPREIVLSTRTNSSAVSAAPRTQASDEDDNEGESVPVPQPTLSNLPQPAAPAAPAQPQQIRTPQQMLEELQRMRQNAQAQGQAGAQQAPPQPQQQQPQQ